MTTPAPDGSPGRPAPRIRTTPWGLLGRGFTIVLPLLTIGIVLQKFFETLQHVVLPVVDRLPGTLIHSPSLRFLGVCMVIAMLLLLIGSIGRTHAGRALGNRLESRLLSRLPFYTLLRNLAAGLVEREGEQSLRAVLLTIDPGVEQLGLLIERHADGRRTVFLPTSPNPGNGTVLVVDASRVRELPVTGRKVLACLGQWGHGTAGLFAEAEITRAGNSAHREGPTP